jgi:hypothetical protein
MLPAPPPSLRRTATGAGRDLLVAAMIVVGFSTCCSLVAGSGWGGGIRSAALLAATGLAIWITGSIRLPPNRAVAAAMAALLAALLAVRGASLVDVLRSGAGPRIDIGTTTIRAVRLWSQGINVYTAAIDRIGATVDPTGTGWRFFSGFKYGPAMIWAYLPGVALGGARGYFVTTAAAQAAIVVLAAAWSSQHRSKQAAVAAAVLTLLPSSLPGELFRSGVNDAVPLALGLASCLARTRDRPALAGALLGASMGAKIMPGLLLAIPVMLQVPRDRLRFVAAAVLAVLFCYTPALADAPRELIANLLLFQWVRPPDSTSLTYFLPRWIRPLLTIAAALAIVDVSLGSPGDKARTGPCAARIAIVVVLFLIGSAAVHGNYLLWLFPFFAVAVACNLWSEAPGAHR